MTLVAHNEVVGRSRWIQPASDPCHTAIYAIDDIKAALKRAQEGERSGKILVAPNGPV